MIKSSNRGTYINQDAENPAGPRLGGLLSDGQLDDPGEEYIVAMQVWMAATMLDLNPDGMLNEHKLNQQYKKWEFFFIWMKLPEIECNYKKLLLCFNR